MFVPKFFSALLHVPRSQIPDHILQGIFIDSLDYDSDNADNDDFQCNLNNDGANYSINMNLLI